MAARRPARARGSTNAARSSPGAARGPVSSVVGARPWGGAEVDVAAACQARRAGPSPPLLESGFEAVPSLMWQ